MAYKIIDSAHNTPDEDIRTGAIQVTPTAITAANPCVATVGAHGFIVGDEVAVMTTGNMVEINGTWQTISAIAATTISLDVDGTVGPFTAFTAGGTIELSGNVGNQARLYYNPAVDSINEIVDAVQRIKDKLIALNA